MDAHTLKHLKSHRVSAGGSLRRGKDWESPKHRKTTSSHEYLRIEQSTHLGIQSYLKKDYCQLPGKRLFL